METSLEPPSLPMLADCASTWQWHTASFTAGATPVDWKTVTANSDITGDRMISFTVFFHSPDPSCSLFYKRDRARPKRGALVQKGKGRRAVGSMCIECMYSEKLV